MKRSENIYKKYCNINSCGLTWLFSSLFFFLSLHLPAQADNIAFVQAEEEFRWGVQSYHAGMYNDALLSFTRTIALYPEHTHAQTWLAESYYASGFLDAAVEEWRRILNVRNDSYITERLQSTTQRYFLLPGQNNEYVEIQSFSMNGEGTLRFNAINVQRRQGGGFYLLSVQKNEILHVSTTGNILARIRGGAENFHAPFDLVEYDDSIFVSEFKANKISRLNKNGQRIGSFGKKGIGPGEFLGPQYLAVDRDGFLYISDWGNKRVQKFTTEGEYLLEFPGLERPVGVAVLHDKVFIVDSARKQLLMFDRDTNLIDILPVALNSPECIRVFDEKHLLISDGNRLLIYNTDKKKTAYTIADASARQLISAVRDENGTIIAIDIKRNTLQFFVNSSSSYSGLHVRVDRIRSTQFPRVVMNVQVADKLGNPVAGLLESDFIVSERNAIVSPLRLILSAEQSPGNLVLLFERSLSAQGLQDVLADAVQDLWQGLGGIRSVAISAERQPIEISADDLADLLLNMKESYFSADWQFDNALRLSSTKLALGGARRSIVFFSAGSLGDGAFTNYSPEALAHYMLVHNISFSVVQLTEQQGSDPILKYLVDTTGGSTAYVYRKEGLAALGKDLQKKASGYYVLEYRSNTDPDFGRSYIPLTVETRVFVRSGKAESGFFPPLEF